MTSLNKRILKRLIISILFLFVTKNIGAKTMSVDKKYAGKYRNFRTVELRIMNNSETNYEKKISIKSKITDSSMRPFNKNKKDNKTSILEHFHVLEVFFNEKDLNKPEFEYSVKSYMSQKLKPTRQVTDAIVVSELEVYLDGKIVEAIETKKPKTVTLVFKDYQGLVAEIITTNPIL